MMLSTKAKTAFLAMPRNASTSIEAALLPFADIAFKGLPRFKHLNLAMYNLRLRPFLNANNYDDVKTVALFREPLCWLKSWYKYRSDPGIKLKRNSTAGLSFNEFIEAYLMEERPDFAKIGQQSNFVLDKNSNIGVDFIFKFDHLAEFNSFMSERFATQFHFQLANASIDRDIETSPSLISELKTKFALDYEIYENVAL